MKFFCNNKKNILRSCIIFLTLIGLTACGGSRAIIPLRSLITPTKDEVVELYWEHKDKLNKVAEIVLANEALRQRMIDTPRSFAQIGSDSWKDSFPEEEWELIVDLFETIRPFRITVHALWSGEEDYVVYIAFRGRIEEEYVSTVTLAYFDPPGARNRFCDIRVRGVILTQLEGGWHVFEDVHER